MAGEIGLARLVLLVHLFIEVGQDTAVLVFVGVVGGISSARQIMPLGKGSRLSAQTIGPAIGRRQCCCPPGLCGRPQRGTPVEPLAGLDIGQTVLAVPPSWPSESGPTTNRFT